jgi:nitroreductase
MTEQTGPEQTRPERAGPEQTGPEQAGPEHHHHVGLYEGLMTLRAMRRLRPDPVPDDLVWACLRAAQQAPSGGNIQPWHFLVVTDPAVRQELGELYRRCYDRYEATLPAAPRNATPEAHAAWQRTVAASRHLAETIGDVPVHVAILGADIDMTAQDDHGPVDIGSVLVSVVPAVQNLMLAARSFGLGTALTTVLRVDQAEFRRILDVPPRWQLIAYVPIGWPQGHFGVAPRRPVAGVTSWDRYGSRRESPPS